MDDLFRRPELANEMARRLLRPGALDEGLRCGLFLCGQRRIGKTTFLINDLIAALETQGATAIYVDLGTNTATCPATLVKAAVGRALLDVQNSGPRTLPRLPASCASNPEAYGPEFVADSGAVEERNIATVAEALRSLVDRAGATVVLVIDSVQYAVRKKAGNSMLIALKAARDAINLRPGTPGYFLLVGAGSDQASVAPLTTGHDQAFLGAECMSFPLLNAAYVDHLLAHVRLEQAPRIPARDVVIAGFATLGNRPAVLVKAFVCLQHIAEGSDTDAMFTALAATLASTAVDGVPANVEWISGLSAAPQEEGTRSSPRCLTSAWFYPLERPLPSPASDCRLEASSQLRKEPACERRIGNPGTGRGGSAVSRRTRDRRPLCEDGRASWYANRKTLGVPQGGCHGILA